MGILADGGGMSGLTDVLKDVAPALATALGGPLAGAAVSFLSSKLGVPAEQVEQAVAGMKPADLLAMKQADQQFQLAMAQQGISLQLAQIEVDKQEAASSSWWTSGWRPGVGWVGVVSLALLYWPKALVLTAMWTYQVYCLVHGAPDASKVVLPAFPDLGVTDLVGLLSSILGIGVMRSAEKITGTEGNR